MESKILLKKTTTNNNISNNNNNCCCCLIVIIIISIISISQFPQGLLQFELNSMSFMNRLALQYSSILSSLKNSLKSKFDQNQLKVHTQHKDM